MARNRPHRCVPTIPCKKDTPVGRFYGYRCKLGKEIYHRTHSAALPVIVADGELRPAASQDVDVFGNQPAISMSSCPTQRVGGDVKLVFDADHIIERGGDRPEHACYIPYHEKESRLTQLDDLETYEIKKCIEKGMHPADASIKCGSLATRGKYMLQPDIYSQECEYNLHRPLRLKDNLKRIELTLSDFDHTHCTDEIHLSETAAYKPFMDWGDVFRERIRQIKEIADRLGVPYEIKSCAPWLYLGMSKYAPASEKNLKILAEHETGPGSWLADVMEGVLSGYPPDSPADFECDCSG